MEIVPVVYHEDPDGWWADSPAVPGWTATAPTLNDLRARVEEGVRFALERDDVIVDHVLSDTRLAPIVFDFSLGETLRGPNLTDPGAAPREQRHLQTA
jgi:predicted RNase H-like HicB family nuclease